MFLNLLKYKILLLAVLFSTPVLSQIYGTTESTNDCPDCCEPKSPPICVTIGSGPLKCNYTDAKRVCVDKITRIAELEDQIERIEKEKVTSQKNAATYKEMAAKTRNEVYKLKQQHDTIQAEVKRIVDKFQNPGWLPWSEDMRMCLTKNYYMPGWSPTFPCPRLCGDTNGGIRQVEYSKWVIEAGAAIIPCGKLGLAFYKVMDDPNIKTTVHLGVETLQTFVSVDGVVRGVCKDAGTCASGDYCLLDTVKEVCKKGLAGKDVIDFRKIATLEEVMSCAKFNPINVGVDLAFVGGRVVADILSCPEDHGMQSMFPKDWLAQAKAAADKIASIFGELSWEVFEYESQAEKLYREIVQLNEKLVGLKSDLKKANGEYAMCVDEALAPTREPDVEIPVDRCQ